MGLTNIQICKTKPSKFFVSRRKQPLALQTTTRLQAKKTLPAKLKWVERGNGLLLDNDLPIRKLAVLQMNNKTIMGSSSSRQGSVSTVRK